MRDIKFRAWDFVNNKMLRTEDILSIASNGKMIQYADQGFLVNGSHGEEFVLMQSTGLSDKNGVEIFEGDITTYGTVAWIGGLNWDSGGSKHPGFYFKETFEAAYEELEYHTGFDAHIEVIGNVFQNSRIILPPRAPHVSANVSKF